jgi:hypothetical protein
MSKQKKPKVEKTPVERAIASRERGIARMEANKEQIMQRAKEQVAEIDRHLVEKRVLLAALKRGQIKG